MKEVITIVTGGITKETRKMILNPEFQNQQQYYFHQSLTSCISILEDGGLVKVVGQIEKRNKYYSIYEFVYDEKERNKLMNNRHKEKFHAWLKLADNYSDFIPEDLLEELNTFKNEKLKNQLKLL